MKDKQDIRINIDVSLPKKERLSSKKKIDALFTKGASFYFYPFSIKFLPVSDEDITYHQMMVSVSKRNFKKAVDRNRVKRLVKESYRLNKYQLNDAAQYYTIAYIYTAKEVHDFRFIEKKLRGSISRLLTKIDLRDTWRSQY